VLLAVQPSSGGSSELFNIRDGTVKYIDTGRASIGVGAPLCDFILSVLGSVREESEMLAMAMYILRAVKANVPNVGMDGHIILFTRDGGWTEFDQAAMNPYESVLARLDNILLVLFEASFSPTATPYPPNIAKELENIRHDFHSLLKSRRQLTIKMISDVSDQIRRLRGAG
jgi:hypothetical protein